ncbi:MAG: DMT family transporter [Clostridia bacterium]|nr:DMT family transporter [Clostridia bacterium]
MKKRQAYLLFVIATMIWGFAFVAQKAAVVLPPFAVCAIRAGIASLFLMAIIPLTDKITATGRKFYTKRGLDLNKREIVGGIVIGIILTVSSVLQQAGLSDTDAGKAAFITTLYVVLVPIFNSFLGKKPGVNVIIGVPVALLGFFFLCIKPGIGIAPSDLMVLGCAFVFTFHIIGVDRLSVGCDGVRLSLVQFIVSFILDMVLSLIFEGVVSGELIMSVLPSLIFLGIGSSGIAYTLQIVGQKHADPNVSSLILSLESVFAVIGASIVLGERMSPREYLGSALVLAAVFMAQTEPDFIKKLLKIQPKANNN